MVRTVSILGPALILLGGCAASDSAVPARETTTLPISPPVAGPSATRILDRDAAGQLLRNSGVTLQWIDWNTRGVAHARDESGTIRLTASQTASSGPGRLFLDGQVTEIGADYFVFSGTISITDTPDSGRKCEATRSDWRFAVTQSRPYWRLRTFEWCDGLTDYIDIYKPR